MDITKYIQDNLNEEQTRAALHIETSSLILAGAGSGKTRTLTYKIAYLIYGLGVYPEEVFAVTFTNKAANEMKHRLVEIAQDIETKLHSPSPSEWSEAEWEIGWGSVWGTKKISFPRIGTFHSLFLKFLKIEISNYKSPSPSEAGGGTVGRGSGWGWTYNTSFGVYDDGESKALVKRIITAKKLEEKVEHDVAKSMISKWKNQWITPADYAKMTKFPSDDYLLIVYQEYQKELEKANMMDFDDLLLIPYLILKSNPDILAKRQRKFQFVLVDEAQDTNWIQFEIMKQFTKNGGNITFIGDDFQSIYRRRGAMMDNFLNVKNIRPDIIIHKLQMNYRSKPHIVHASNFIIRNNQKQYEKTVVPHRNGNDKIVIMSHGDEIDEAKHIIELIAKIKEEKNKKREQFAILYRKNALSSSFEQQLIMEGIPYKIFGWFKFLERKEVKDILAYVKYLYNPKDNVSLKRIINTPRRGISDDTVKAIEEYGMIHSMSIDEIINNPITLSHTGLASRAIESCKKFSQMMHFLKDSIETMTPENLISQIISTISYKEYLTETEGKQAQEKIDNLWELINLASKYEL